ncbi:GTP-binding protein Di-Ras2-like isoform X1 [Bactrocera tryoni]|uniref:GTP-binding protein Di-Ras2-like isoform X1 n=1 Tax=Bactrocera tryoni TaxID=59916 RepID=UPI001A96B163|nr:GTP-binding protein Di-Ras2-like isoform X1 [Bactrocera tryoni]XP_039956030.1 GTP-binding protein Di-Ras2-like isoform X1 [Bactrocera tryoni]XP_039956031.1 GTP-binding protein Di-Ras2-like isoform X1 [Bactrocera tryoni]
MTDLERIRLAMLGGAGVGKSSIIKRFLFKTYTDKYRATVEDLFSREYDLGGVTLKVDILDTSGDMELSAMRRLSIATAHAFMLVYASTSASSFQCVKQCFQEIREQRADYQNIPIVIAGNKSDLANTHREVRLEEVTDWVYCELPRLRAKVLECSAKEDQNVTDLFKTLLSLSRFLPVGSNNDGTSGLKRRSSAYVSASSSRNKNRNASPSVSGGKKSSLVEAVDPATSCGDAKLKPRSRSLIRRVSRKTKQQIHNASDDCNLQ